MIVTLASVRGIQHWETVYVEDCIYRIWDVSAGVGESIRWSWSIWESEDLITFNDTALGVISCHPSPELVHTSETIKKPRMLVRRRRPMCLMEEGKYSQLIFLPNL